MQQARLRFQRTIPRRRIFYTVRFNMNIKSVWLTEVQTDVPIMKDFKFKRIVIDADFVGSLTESIDLPIKRCGSEDENAPKVRRTNTSFGSIRRSRGLLSTAKTFCNNDKYIDKLGFIMLAARYCYIAVRSGRRNRAKGGRIQNNILLKIALSTENVLQ